MSVEETLEIDEFGVFKLEKIAHSENSCYKNFYYDNNHQFYFLFDSSNKITYRNINSKKAKTFDSLFANELINFFFIECYKTIIFIYEKGDIYIIPVDFIESDNFDFHWKKVLDPVYKHDEKERNIKPSIYDNFVITDLLFCNDKSRDDDEKFRFSQSKSDKFRSYIYHKNILTNKNLDVNFKFFKNTNVIFWANNNSMKFGDKIAKFLILNINTHLFFLLLSNLDCEIVLKFNYFIDNFLYIDYKSEYQYIILETQSEYYRLVLLDIYNDINILDMDASKIIPSKLNLFNYSNLSIQTYNKEPIIVNLNNNFYFMEIFHPNDIDVPLIHISLNNISSQIFSVLTYEKTIILICFENNKFNFKIFSSKIAKSDLSEKITEQTLDWYNIDFQYLEKFLFTKDIYLTNLIKFNINQDSCSTDLTSLFDQDISKKLKEKVLKDKIKICKATPMSKNLLSILTEKSLYVMNVFYNLNNENVSSKLIQLEFDYKNLRRFEIFFDALNLNYMDAYNNIIETNINDNNPKIKEKRLKLLLLTLPSINLFENLIKLYLKCEKSERSIIKSFISYNLQTLNNSTLKEYLYSSILIHIFERTENNNILKNFKNFFIYFENINLMKFIDYFNHSILNNKESSEQIEYQYCPDDLQDDKFSINSLNQLNYSSDEINISKKNLFLAEEKLNQQDHSTKTVNIYLKFNEKDDENLLTKALLILYTKNFFNILIFSLLNNKHISKDFAKKIKESEDQKYSNFFTIRSNTEYIYYFFKKVSKSLLLLDCKSYLKMLTLKVLFYADKLEGNFLEELYFFKLKQLNNNDCIEIFHFLQSLVVDNSVDLININGKDLLNLTYLSSHFNKHIEIINIDQSYLSGILIESIKIDMKLIEKSVENKYLALLLNLRFYCLEKLINLFNLYKELSITNYLSSLEKINSKKTLIYKKINEVKQKILGLNSKNDETINLIYMVLNQLKGKAVNVEEICAEHSENTKINHYKFKEILTNLKKNTNN